MKYLIGMDGGGTKTDCIVTDLDGDILYKCSGGPSNFLVIGKIKTCDNIFRLITECKNKLNTSYDDIQTVVIGTAGAGRKTDAEFLEKEFGKYLLSKNIKINFHVESDARIALEGAFSGNPGSILISGTGSIIFGKDMSGTIHRVGGYGRYIGDLGSGYNIGRKGLQIITKHLDGRGDFTSLTKIFAARFNINNTTGLIEAVYKNNFDIASVAPLVIETAEKGDTLCNKIIDKESDELILHVLAMVKVLKLQEFRLALAGSLISTNNYFSRTFRKKIGRLAVKIIIREPDMPPAMGSILIAQSIGK